MADNSRIPAVKPIGDLRLPRLNTEILSNGIEFCWIDRGSVDANTMMVLWPGGPVESSNPEAVAACVNMMREGAAGLSTAEINEKIDYCGALMQFRVQGHHSGIGVSTISRLTPDMLQLLRKMIVEPTYPENAFDHYKQITAQQIEIERAKVMALGNQALSRLIMGEDNPNVPRLNPEAVMNLRSEDLVESHRRIVGHHGAKAYMSGRLPEWLLAETRAMLETLPTSGEGVSIKTYPFESQAPQTVHVDVPTALQSAVCMAMPAPLRSNPDYLPLRFAVMALGGYFGSRLMKNIREDKGYTYGINASLVGQLDGSYININAQADNRYVDKLIEETKRELEKMGREPMDKEEMNRVCQYVAASCLETLDSPFSVMNYYLTQEMVGLPDNYFAEQVRLVREIDAQTIMRMAQKYFVPDQLRIAVAGR